MKKKMGVPCMRFKPYFIGHAPVHAGFELFQHPLDGFVVKALSLGVVKRDLPLAALSVCHILHLLSSLAGDIFFLEDYSFSVDSLAAFFVDNLITGNFWNYFNYKIQK